MVTLLALAGAGHASGALLFYSFHRFIFHGPLGRLPVLRHWRSIHTRHHRRPHDPGAFFFPWWANISIWAAAVALFLVSPAFGGGMISFFCLYAYRHRQAHLGSTRRWAIHHQSHHYLSPKANFSGSWPIIDRLFGTYEPYSKEIVRHAIRRRERRL